MRQAVILVGGRGTRLGHLARDLPKPLVPIVGDLRFLDYLLRDVARHGVEDIVLLAGHLAHVVEERYGNARAIGARVRVSVEPSPAGTGGALRHAADLLDDKFLMLNGDSLIDLNYLALSCALGGDVAGVVALRRVPDARRFGRVETRGDRIVSFHEKDEGFHGEALISAGVYALKREILELVGDGPCSIESDVFPKLAASNALVGVESSSFFIDIGLPDTLSEARANLAEQMQRGAVFFDRDGTLNKDDGYTFKPEALGWQPGAIEAIRLCNDAGRLVIVVTNQAGVARGYYTESDVRRFHIHMQNQLRPHGAHVDAFYYCPFHVDGAIGPYAYDHPDRKPRSGMIRRSFTEWPIDRARSFLVGDSDADMQAAKEIGLPAYRVRPGELLPIIQRGLSEFREPKRSAPARNAQLKQRAKVGRSWLFDHALPLWWERGFDRNVNCFEERLSFNGEPVLCPRRIRVQARQTIVYARAGRLGWPGPWREAVEAGARVLVDRGMRADGGARHLLGPSGEPLDDRRDLYDLAFVIFALAEAGQALGKRPDLIEASERLVNWAETNWAHPQGGFSEGDITPTPPRRQNPHMHMFEALLALHEATGAQAHLDRASALAHLFHHKLFDPVSGAMPEYFDDEWRPLPDEDGSVVEPGHLFEWSWLLHRWSGLGGGDLRAAAERLRVHGEVYGVEVGSGAVHDEIFIDGRPRKISSRLWPQTERIKANLARYELTRDGEAADAAGQAFDMLMNYCDTPTRGLWFDVRAPDGSFVEEAARASSFYHIMLALSEFIRVSAD